MSKGAKLSMTLHNFLVSSKIIEGKKLNALPKKTVQKKEVEAAAPAPKAQQGTTESPVEAVVETPAQVAETTPTV
jgi:hypothetical protein